MINIPHAAFLGTLFFSFVISSCGIHPRDNSQIPIIKISKGVKPEISWQSGKVYQVAIFDGIYTGDPRNSNSAIWSISAPVYENKVYSPIVYGASVDGLISKVKGIIVNNSDNKTAALEAGKTYTIAVDRKDPKGSGDGFSNTHHTYVAKKQFKVAKAKLKPCSAAWFTFVESKIQSSDAAGHGPDIGSLEWKSAVEFKLAIRGNSNTPDASTNQWCEYIDTVISNNASD